MSNSRESRRRSSLQDGDRVNFGFNYRYSLFGGINIMLRREMGKDTETEKKNANSQHFCFLFFRATLKNRTEQTTGDGSMN